MKKNPIGQYVKATECFPSEFGEALYQIIGDQDEDGTDGFILTLQFEVPAASLWVNYIWLSRFETFQLIKNKVLDNRGYYLELLSEDEFLLEKIK